MKKLFLTAFLTFVTTFSFAGDIFQNSTKLAELKYLCFQYLSTCGAVGMMCIESEQTPQEVMEQANFFDEYLCE